MTLVLDNTYELLFNHEISDTAIHKLKLEKAVDHEGITAEAVVNLPDSSKQWLVNKFNERAAPSWMSPLDTDHESAETHLEGMIGNDKESENDR